MTARKTKATERAERKVIHVAVSWYEWDHTVTDEEDGYASSDIAESKLEELTEAISVLVLSRRTSKRKAKP